MDDKGDAALVKKEASAPASSGSLVISIVFIIISFVIIVLAFVILTVKRQITRARSRQMMFASAPLPIATGATPAVRQRVAELIDRNRSIQRIPQVFSDCFRGVFEDKLAEKAGSHYVFRLKAVDEFQEMVQHFGELGFRRGVHQSVDSYLGQLKKTVLKEVNIDESLRSLCALHEHCVSDPRPFGYRQYEQFRDLLVSLRSLVDERLREQRTRLNRQSDSRLSRRLSTGSSDNSETNPLIDLGFTNVGFSQGRELLTVGGGAGGGGGGGAGGGGGSSSRGDDAGASGSHQETET